MSFGYCHVLCVCDGFFRWVADFNWIIFANKIKLLRKTEPEHIPFPCLLIIYRYPCGWLWKNKANIVLKWTLNMGCKQYVNKYDGALRRNKICLWIIHYFIVWCIFWRTMLHIYFLMTSKYQIHGKYQTIKVMLTQ